MGVPTSEVGYTPAMPRREDHEVHKGHVVALDTKKRYLLFNKHYYVNNMENNEMTNYYKINQKTLRKCMWDDNVKCVFNCQNVREEAEFVRLRLEERGSL